MFARSCKMLAICMLLLLLSGCSRAPSIDVWGSFLPSWMFCGAAGLAITIFTHLALLARRLERYVTPLIVFYPSLALALTCAFWLLFYR